MKNHLMAGTAVASVLAVIVASSVWQDTDPVAPPTPISAGEKNATTTPDAELQDKKALDELQAREGADRRENTPLSKEVYRSNEADRDGRLAGAETRARELGDVVGERAKRDDLVASQPVRQMPMEAEAPAASGPARGSAVQNKQAPNTSTSSITKTESFAPQAAQKRAVPGLSSDDKAGNYAHYEGRDQFEHKEPNPVKRTHEEPVSTFSVDVDTASYAFMRKAVNSGHLPQKDAVRVEELVNYFDYDYPLPESAKQPFKPTVAVYPTPWNKGTKLLHIGIKGHDIVPSKKPRSNLVFLLDVSGSMNHPDKLPLLKSAFRLLVENLGKDDTVAIVTYAGRAGTVLEPTKGSEKGKILAALDRLQSGGSTAGAQGIQQAYALAEQNFDKKAVNRVILATDGDFNVGITNRDELKGYIERKRESGIFLSVLGFGQGNYNDALMQALAQNGNGNAAYIDTLNEARKVLVNEASSTLFPIAKDVKIQIEFNPAMVSEYRLIGYETRILNREDFNNDKVDAGDIGSGHAVTAIYEITPAGSEAELIDDLRYQRAEAKPARGEGNEYAFLKLRYKLPKEDKSKLITLPITKALEADGIEDTPEDVRFAASVAAFGELLRGKDHMGEFSYDDVVDLAKGAKGEDEFGYRAEFLNLVRLAKSARGM